MPELSALLSREAVELLTASGDDLVRRIGMDAVRGVILDVLSGRNLRNSTETLTRRRIAALNLALVHLFLEGKSRRRDFVERLPFDATENLKAGSLSRAERWINQWALGLTDKGMQNILRDDPHLLDTYRDEYVKTCQEVFREYERAIGPLSGTLSLSPSLSAEVDWLLMVYLLNMVGAQALSIRGSEKSAYGKLFEKLILGSLLHAFGFKYTSPEAPSKLAGVYWLSTKGERRESDATLLYKPGVAVRFDIGFIGRGNPEISLDKVTRYEREITIGKRKWYVTTVIIVDRIGPKSRLPELAKRVDGHIVQMSAAYWPQSVANLFKDVLGYSNPLARMPQSRIRGYLLDRLASAPLEQFIRVGGTDSELVEEDSAEYLPL